MLSSFSSIGLGVIMLVLFGVFYWLGILATTRALLAFVGLILVGYHGFIGSALSAVVTWVADLGSSVTGWAVGVHVGGVVLTVIAGVIFIHDLMPRHAANKRTGWAGIALAALLISGATGIPALSGVAPAVRTGVTNARSVVGG